MTTRPTWSHIAFGGRAERRGLSFSYLGELGSDIRPNHPLYGAQRLTQGVHAHRPKRQP